MNRTKTKYRRWVALVSTLVVLIGGLYLVSVNSSGERQQSELQAKYDDYTDTFSECLQEYRATYTNLTEEELDQILVPLAALSMVEFVDESGTPGNYPEVISGPLSYSVDYYTSSDFDQQGIPDLLSLFTRCRGATSSIHDRAVNFASWIDGGYTPFDRAIRSNYPGANSLKAIAWRSEDYYRDSDALLLMSEVVGPNTDWTISPLDRD